MRGDPKVDSADLVQLIGDAEAEVAKIVLIARQPECPYGDEVVAEKVGEIHDLIMECVIALHDR
jgi:hypothetical protein